MINNHSPSLPFGLHLQSAIHQEWEVFFKENPTIETIDLLFCDMAGIIRGKSVPVCDWNKCIKGEVLVPGSGQLLDHEGAATSGIMEGMEDGDPDHICWPIANTLITLSKTSACALIAIGDNQGQPIFSDGYGIVNRVVHQLKDINIEVQIAIELEFYLLDLKEAYQGYVRVASSPVTQAPLQGCQVYHMETLGDFAPFFQELHTMMGQNNIALSTVTKEYAPGQFEINLNHSSDVLRAISEAILFKHCLRICARKHGWLASFLAKPLEEHAGSGLHVHCSLWDKKGNNIGIPMAGEKSHFVDPNHEVSISSQLYYAIGGLRKTMNSAMLVFASDMNAYRRLQPGSYAPENINWGYNNRTVPLRIPAGGSSARRIEHRTSSANANIALTVAAILAGIHYGVQHKIDPGSFCQNNTSHEDIPIVVHWWEAIAQWQNFEHWKDYFGDRFHDRFWRVQQHNLDLFIRKTRASDYTIYLPYM